MSRQALYADGKNIEILAAYEPAFRFMAEWWKQLYGCLLYTSRCV